MLRLLVSRSSCSFFQWRALFFVLVVFLARVASFVFLFVVGGARGVFLFLSAGVKRVCACSSRKAPQLHLVISLLLSGLSCPCLVLL